ncbi:Acyl-CoA N-acyltransferase [Metarhizium album ARSEF 1941]|uniref:Acyl-CoA N-acyltransferase n=1 Tax=Metarhizium album (strain ARSEF 1941) TaxID=1081103 RepID=A0A0B2WK46_METAS|nr:Acyl-CoA N-acyltransferase [Metarhizium album ARSEF 1941]KHN94273.1 Acyl-CoA N-acyltransferase [Metarhizium album ARSEF 1941]
MATEESTDADDKVLVTDVDSKELVTDADDKKSVTGADGEGLVCTRANSKQIMQHFENNSQMWAAPLSLGQYLDMQFQLVVFNGHRASPKHWALFKPCDPETIISSCAVHLRDAIMNSGRGMEPVTAAIITEVFTHPEFRRNGMATKLLSKVKQDLDAMEKDRVEFSIIYSGSSTGLYDKLG